MPSSPFRRRGLAAILAVALVGTGGLAYAAIPDAGVIHTCYAKSTGAWRVIDTAPDQSCKSNEAALDLYSKDGANLAFLAKNGKAADSELLDGQDSSAFLGSNAKAADSDRLDGMDSADFLTVDATAADSDRLGGILAGNYIVGGGVRLLDAGNLQDGENSSFTCCEDLELTPTMTVELRCDTSGNTTLVAFSPGSFRWWWAGTFGNAAPVASGFEAEFGIANGAARNSLRTTTGGIAVAYDLDTFIGTTCNFGWTWTQAYHTTPNIDISAARATARPSDRLVSPLAPRRPRRSARRRRRSIPSRAQANVGGSRRRARRARPRPARRRGLRSRPPGPGR